MSEEVSMYWNTYMMGVADIEGRKGVSDLRMALDGSVRMIRTCGAEAGDAGYWKVCHYYDVVTPRGLMSIIFGS